MMGVCDRLDVVEVGCGSAAAYMAGMVLTAPEGDDEIARVEADGIVAPA